MTDLESEWKRSGGFSALPKIKKEKTNKKVAWSEHFVCG